MYSNSQYTIRTVLLLQELDKTRLRKFRNTICCVRNVPVYDTCSKGVDSDEGFSTIAFLQYRNEVVRNKVCTLYVDVEHILEILWISFLDFQHYRS